MAGFDDGIMLTPEGHVSEGAVTNTFLVLKGRLVTPPPSDGILLGMTRDSVMQLARNELGMETIERSVVRSELYEAEEAFFTGTYAGVVPIVEIDHRQVGEGTVGALTTRLQELYRELAVGRNPKYSAWYTFLRPE
jgi:branched-chain amino acid aminotransferase